MRTDPAPDAPTARPRGAWHLFVVFTGLALRGFGGVLPWAQRVLVEETRWMTRDEYLETLSLAQALPGPNICNLALMVGERFGGVRGALAALAGMFAAPLAIAMSLAVLHAGIAHDPDVANALSGMAAVSAGLIAGMALKLLRGQRIGAVGGLFLAAAFVSVGLLRWPLPWVMPTLGALAVAAAMLERRR